MYHKLFHKDLVILSENNPNDFEYPDFIRMFSKKFNFVFIYAGLELLINIKIN